MIIVKLWGGLGNQLFQYAYGYSLAKRVDTELWLDISFYEKQIQRQPKLLSFNIEYTRILEVKDIPLIVKWLNSKQLNRIIRIPPNSCFKIGKKLRYLKESRLKYSYFIDHYDLENTYIDGYWQCPKYFKSCYRELHKLLNLDISSNPQIGEIEKEICQGNSVAVHIRHGDYMANKAFYSNLIMLPRTYYTKCLSSADSALKNPHYYIFTDDPVWAKKEFSNITNATIISGSINCSDVEELILMSRCKHQIIANSTFSWWAAWLNQNSEKMVWAPEEGWGNKDILPNNWKIIYIK